MDVKEKLVIEDLQDLSVREDALVKEDVKDK
jgi:hypothetical protein